MLFMLIGNWFIIVTFTWINILKLLVLISNQVHVDRHKQHKQKLLRVLNNFWEHKGVLRPKNLRAAAPGHSCPCEHVCFFHKTFQMQQMLALFVPLVIPPSSFSVLFPFTIDFTYLLNSVPASGETLPHWAIQMADSIISLTLWSGLSGTFSSRLLGPCLYRGVTSWVIFLLRNLIHPFELLLDSVSRWGCPWTK